MKKHFIDINYFSKQDLRTILDLAKKIKKNPKNYSSILKNKHLGLLFEKQSNRTRLSFTVGMKKLGGEVIDLEFSKIGFGKRESAEDILKTMSQYLDVLIIRNNDHNQLIKLAKLNTIPIINGLSNFSHPCQILSDIFTIEECLGNIENKKIVWMGDYNNVLISLIQAAEIFKFSLDILMPNLLIKKANKYCKTKKLKFSKFVSNINAGLKNADCVMTDVWISMGEKKSNHKIKILKNYQVNEEVMKKTKKTSIFMHCLPAHRNEEVTDSVIDGKKSVVWLQAKNRTYVQQSILCYLLKNEKN
tara:strand:- start:41 stop:949 length:909 start_codon:yes stop_codon:yes gene_type:complete